MDTANLNEGRMEEINSALGEIDENRFANVICEEGRDYVRQADLESMLYWSELI